MDRSILSSGIFVGFYTLGIFSYMPYLAPYIESILQHSSLYGIPLEVWLGILASIPPLTVIFTTHYIGALADQYGRQKLIRVGLISSIIALLLFIFAPSPLPLMLARVFIAIGFTSITLISLAKVNDHIAEKHRGKEQGVFLSLQYLGNIFGSLLGGWLVAKYTIIAPFYFLLCIVVVLLVIAFLQKPDVLTERKQATANILKNWKTFLQFRKLKGMAVLGITSHAHASIILFFLPIYILKLYPGHYEYAAYAFIALNVFKPLQFIIGPFIDKYGKAVSTLCGGIVMGLAIFLIPDTHSITGLLGVLALFSLGNSVWNIGAWTLMSSIGEANSIEGHVVGSYSSIVKVGDFIGSIIFGFIAAAAGIAILFPIGASITLAGVLLSLPFFRKQTMSL